MIGLLAFALVAFPSCPTLAQLSDPTADPVDTTVIVGSPSMPPKKLIVSVEADIDEDMQATISTQMENLADGQEVEVHMDTDGGDVDASLAIAKMLEKASVAHEVTCIVDGGALSGGFAILQSCPTRIATARSYFLIHEAFVAAARSLTTGKLMELLEQNRVATGRYLAQCGARLNMKAADLAKKVRGKDWWFLPDEALALGAIDEIADSPNKALKARTRKTPPGKK